MEIIDRHDTNTHRAVCTVQFADVIYVLHAFQKKSPSAALPRRGKTLISFAAGLQKLSGLTGKGAMNRGD